MATVASGLNGGAGYNSSDTITSTTLNNHVNNATVTGIVNADVASNAAIAVTKLAEITAQNVLGNVGGGNASVPIVGATGLLLDEDTMSTDSNTKGATQQSIKAYVDTYALKSSSSSAFSFNTTNSFADLDISSVVGSNKALVFALVVKTSAGGTNATNIAFRTKGDTVNPMDTTNLYGAGSSGLAVGDTSTDSVGGYVSVITDSNGIIQHRSNDVSQTGFTFQVKAFQILQ